MVDLIKSQLLPAWPFSSVTLRYQQKKLSDQLNELETAERVHCAVPLPVRTHLPELRATA
jgi:hypothetical protein